jgi:chromosomal replication initiator protein
MLVNTIWFETRRRLAAALSEKDFETWIAPLQAAGWAEDELTVEVPSGLFRDWLKRHYLTVLQEAVAGATGQPAGVRLVVNPALAQPTPRRAVAAQAVPEPRPGIKAEEPPRCTFETFVVGASNEVAYNASRAVVAQPGSRFNPLFLWGGCGLGKTHLLSAVGWASGGGRRRGVECLSAESFVNEMIGALKRDQMDRFRQRFRHIRMLVMDDVQFLAGKKRSQEEFTHTFNALHETGRQIVLASDRPPNEMPGIEATLRNRFSAGLLVDVQPPDPALRLALVERKATALGFQLDIDVVRYLAEHWCGNVRELEGALTRIDAARALSGREPTLELVRGALAPYARPLDGRLTVTRIVSEVCRHYRVTRAELSSPRRTARIALARHVTMYLCRRHTDASLDAIGAEFGGRDHSTVVHALSAIERKLGSDAELRDAVGTLEARLAG